MKTAKILSILSALLLLLSVLSCCAGKGTPADSSAEPTDSLPSAEATGQAAAALCLIRDGESTVRVVRPEMAENGSVATQGAVAIRKELQKYGEGITIGDDWSRDGTHDAALLEILVGNTNYPETAEVAKATEGADWQIRIVGNKVVVFSRDDRALQQAVDRLCACIAAAAEKDGSGRYSLVLSPEQTDGTGAYDRIAARIPQPDGAAFQCFYDPGDSCDEVIYNGATAEAFRAYVEKLKAAGYKVHAENEVNGSAFCTLYNADYTVNAGFYVGEKRLRVIAEPCTPESLFGAEKDNVYTPVTTSRITMVGCQYTRASDGGQENTGASFVIRLSDGRFVILDGGHNRSQAMSNIVKILKEQSADYAAKTGGIRIAAWILTHPHSDHYRALTGYCSQLTANKIAVECLMFNFLSAEEMEKCYAKYKDDLRYDQQLIYNTARALKTKVVIPHVGQKYYLADMVMETVFTIESYGPSLINDLNGLSLMAKLTFTDPATGKQTSFMTVGDATGYDFRAAAGTFGTALKSDICQIAHHGASTKGDDSGTIMGYKLILPKTVLWSSGQGAYDAYWDNAYNNVVINEKTNPEFRECFVAGLSGRQVILDLPYQPGEAKVVEP